MPEGRNEGHTWINTTSAPASAKAKAIACPMPLVPPVTTAVWPLREKSELTVADIVAIELVTQLVMIGNECLKRGESGGM